MEKRAEVRKTCGGRESLEGCTLSNKHSDGSGKRKARQKARKGPEARRSTNYRPDCLGSSLARSGNARRLPKV